METKTRTLSTKIFSIGCVFIISMLLSSCYNASLQSAEVFGPEMKSSVKLAKNDNQPKLTFRPFLIGNFADELNINTGTHSKVNPAGVYQLDETSKEGKYIERAYANSTTFDGQNLKWQTPTKSFGFDLEIANNNMVYEAGVVFSEVGGSRYLSKNAGISWFSQNGLRIGFNAYWQTLEYKAEILNRENNPDFEDRDVYFSYYEGSENFVNFDIFLSARSNWNNPLVDIFGQINIGSQTLVNFRIDESSDKENIKYSESTFGLTFGIIKEITNNARFILGYRNNFYNDYTYENVSDVFLQYEIDINFSD